ncbi:hypothetical protein RP20_CCG025199 [Aedes albopictus]|nr:hypothetical protein RP20_CCG025199 [Aedes albopictus]
MVRTLDYHAEDLASNPTPDKLAKSLLSDLPAAPPRGGGDLLPERLTLREFFLERWSLRLSLLSLRLRSRDTLRFTGRYMSRLENLGEAERERDLEREREREREYELRLKTPRRS